MKRTKIGVIGLGRAGTMHLENMMTLPEIEVEAVSDIHLTEHQKTELAKKGIKYFHQDYRELLAHKEIEAVFIFSPSNTHEQILLDAAEAKKHIFCEKPLTMNLDEAVSSKIVQSIEKNKVKLAVGFNRRVDKQFFSVYKKVSAGDIGFPQIIKLTSRDPNLLPHELIQRIGGLVVDFTMHDLDMARFIMGSNIKKVYAKGGTLIDPTLREIDDYDTLVVMLEFENGGYGLIDNSRQAVYGYDQRLEVFGSKGMLKFENMANNLVEYYAEGQTQRENPLPNFASRYHRSYMNEVQLFIQSFEREISYLAAGEDAIMAQRAAAGILKSLQTGIPVSIDTSLPVNNN